MFSIQTAPSPKFAKCCCCGESVYTGERIHTVCKDGNPIRGQRYCDHCQDNILLAYPEIAESHDDGESHLRQMEDYAAYRAAGCSSQYWEDRDNGYAR